MRLFRQSTGSARILALVPLALGAASLCSAGSITYQISLPAGVGSATGYIVTDGTIGVLGQANIIAYNLFLSDPAASSSTWTLVCCNFFPFYGSALSATATQLLFNFSGTGVVDFADPTLDFQLCLSTAGGSGGPCQGAGVGLSFLTLLPSFGYNYQFTSVSGTAVIGTATATPITTTTTVKYGPNPSAYGEPVTFRVSVTPNAGSPPNGAVLFESKALVLAKVKLSGGEATWKTSTLPQGQDSITAVFAGNRYFEGSSVTVPQTVDPAPSPIVAGCTIANSQSGFPPYPGSCTITNQGPDEDYNVRVSSVTMNGVSCAWKEPKENLTPGQSVSFDISCDNVNTACNVSNTLTINGTDVGGTFSGSTIFLWCTGP